MPEQPDKPQHPTALHDPLDPDQDAPTIPLPPDTNSQPPEPIRDPGSPEPISEPDPAGPTRLL